MAPQPRIDDLEGDAAANSHPSRQRDVRSVAELRNEKAPRDRTAKQDTGTPGQAANLRAAVRTHPYVTLVIIIVVAAGLIGGAAWWLQARHFESTDDAFVDARTVTVSPQVGGAIVAVPVTDNQFVETGAVLVELDRRDYDAAVAQAKAQVEQAQAAVANATAQIDAQAARIDQARQQVEQAQAALTFAQSESKRAQELLSRGFGTQQQAQQTASTREQNQATLQQEQSNLVAAEKQTAVLEAQRQSAAAQVDQANAQLVQAQANLSRTRITAPVGGRPAKISAAVGATAQVGQALMMFVPREVWVTANFKESQLADMRAGQPVEIAVDAYPGKTFAGHVDSIQPGSGAAFSLLPPENATGNFVKVVQRVPVKIVFDRPPDVYLGPGMSVVPRVTVR
jgi:membrane fusion protein, multidrug efflux system